MELKQKSKPKKMLVLSWVIEMHNDPKINNVSTLSDELATTTFAIKPKLFESIIEKCSFLNLFAVG